MKIPIPRIVRAVAHEVRVRRDVSQLEEFSDRMLADIGISRSDVHRAARGRLWRRLQ
jgi:uncharacterized protein YjiS (DUF1127 family)